MPKFCLTPKAIEALILLQSDKSVTGDGFIPIVSVIENDILSRVQRILDETAELWASLGKFGIEKTAS